ncbi:MAG: YdeI/OmpD-associated family protein [Candidatus Pacebacteria bacterium]|jgi:uncharacterized protein YdeI (YjbR/CyaY-like superfamily)|nr:YdeI/OmpD-associated family protein [Candidatus Paceibacterota bacterium]MBP9780531.1 YdeI/OmpD-associated family protein [Candidatus Paceibacterota bacterium]
MTNMKISAGVAHTLPSDVKTILSSKASLLNVWEDITPLARNEWICWITSAKMEETRNRRIKIMSENLLKGKRRPCCWIGCPHRKK